MNTINREVIQKTKTLGKTKHYLFYLISNHFYHNVENSFVCYKTSLIHKEKYSDILEYNMSIQYKYDYILRKYCYENKGLVNMNCNCEFLQGKNIS